MFADKKKESRQLPTFPLLKGGVSSALKDLTSGFGMGPGVTSSALPPRLYILQCFFSVSRYTGKKNLFLYAAAPLFEKRP